VSDARYSDHATNLQNGAGVYVPEYAFFQGYIFVSGI